MSLTPHHLREKGMPADCGPDRSVPRAPLAFRGEGKKQFLCLYTSMVMSRALPQYGESPNQARRVTHKAIAAKSGVRRETVTRWFGRFSNSPRKRLSIADMGDVLPAAPSAVHGSAARTFSHPALQEIFRVECNVAAANDYDAPAALRGDAGGKATRTAEKLAEAFGENVFDKNSYVNGFKPIYAWLWHETLPDPLDCQCRLGQLPLPVHVEERSGENLQLAHGVPSGINNGSIDGQRSSVEDSAKSNSIGSDAAMARNCRPDGSVSGAGARCHICAGRGWVIERQRCTCLVKGKATLDCTRCAGSGECVVAMPDLGRMIATYYLWKSIEDNVPELKDADGRLVRYHQPAGIFQQTQERTCRDMGINEETLRKYNRKLADLLIIRIIPGDKYDAEGKLVKEGDGRPIISSDPDKILWMPGRLLDHEICVAEYQRFRAAMKAMDDQGYSVLADQIAVELLKEWQRKEHSLGAYWNELRRRMGARGVPQGVRDALIPYQGG